MKKKDLDELMDGVTKRTLKLMDDYLSTHPECSTQRDFANLVGIPNNRISLWRTGGAAPSITDIIRLWSALGVSPELLITGKAISDAALMKELRTFSGKLDEMKLVIQKRQMEKL